MATSNPIFIGITGGSCSGKTTFCSALEKELAPLSPIVFHMDDYYLPPEERPHMTGFADGKDYIDDNSPASFQLDALRQELDDALQSGAAVVILEGLLTLWDEEIFRKLDLRLYVDCPDEERLARRVQRHSGWGQELSEITGRYVNAVRPRFRQYTEPCKWRADLILNGSHPSETAMEMICGQIFRLAKQKGVSHE